MIAPSPQPPTPRNNWPRTPSTIGESVPAAAKKLKIGQATIYGGIKTCKIRV